MTLSRSLGTRSSGKKSQIHPLWCVFALLKIEIWWKMTKNGGRNLVCKLPNRCGWNFWFPFHFQNRHIRWPSCKISRLLLEVHNSFTIPLHYNKGLRIYEEVYHPLFTCSNNVLLLMIWTWNFTGNEISLFRLAFKNFWDHVVYSML